MAIIPGIERGVLKRKFRKDLKEEVTIRFFTKTSSLLTIPGRDCPSCPQIMQLLQELTDLSPKLHLKTYDFYNQSHKNDKYQVERIPAITFGNNRSGRLKYYGMPSEHQFSPIISTIVSLSRGINSLGMSTKKLLQQLKVPVTIHIFVTRSCVYCPEMVRLCYAMALQSEYITANIVSIDEFPDIGQRYSVRGVPKTIMGNISPLTRLPEIEFVGPVSESEFVSKILQVSHGKSSEDTSQ